MDEEKETPKSFSPFMVSWLIAIVVGIIAPLFTQEIVARQVSNLSVLPSTGEETPNAATTFAAAIVLFVAITLYVTAIGFQIFYISLRRKISSILPFVITALGPLFIWLVLPYSLIFLAGK